jgi:hypothetical protein
MHAVAQPAFGIAPFGMVLANAMLRSRRDRASGSGSDPCLDSQA